MTTCKYCDEEITFDDDHVSEYSGKKIPLDPETNEPHECEEYRQQHRKTYPCRKHCGGRIYFDPDQRTDTGKWIPIDSETEAPHSCEGREEYEEDEAEE